MEAKKKKVVNSRKGNGSLRDNRSARRGGTNESARVARLTKASDQRARPSAIRAVAKSIAQIASIRPLLSLISRTVSWAPLLNFTALSLI